MLVKLQNVSHFYGNHLIFKDISLEITRGSILILAGANGAGKTTLLRLLAGLVAPSTGTVSYGTSGKPSIGLVGHETFIYPDLTATENLLFWGKLHKKEINPKTCAQLLEQVELASFAHEKAGIFSRGMAQRLSLARVFMLEPSLLLLDEPSTGLDANSLRILYQSIISSKNKGTGIVWISHQIPAEVHMADTVAFLAKKRLAYLGNTQGFQEQYPIYACQSKPKAEPVPNTESYASAKPQATEGNSQTTEGKLKATENSLKAVENNPQATEGKTC